MLNGKRAAAEAGISVPSAPFVIRALSLVPSEVITIFRCPGAWEADAFKILDKYNIDYCDRTVSLSEAAQRAVAKLTD